MTLEAFATLVQDKIKEYLPICYADAEVEIRHVTKNNSTHLTGISIRKSDMNVAPTVYLENLYQEFENGRDFDELLSYLASVILRENVKLNFDVQDLASLELCREKIYPKLINTDMNAEILKERPHREIADLSVTYQVTLSDESIGIGSVAVTNNLMDAWGIDEKELNTIAIHNLEKQEVLLKSIGSMVAEMIGAMGTEDPFDEEISGEIGMYVLTNKEKLNGANILLNKNKMKEISEMTSFRRGYYILPSSTAEVILVPKSSSITAETLAELVRDVNRTTVEPELQLSNNVYEYSDVYGLQIAV